VQAAARAGDSEAPRELAPDLIARLPARDPAAMASFFDAYFPRIYGYIRGLVRDEHLAEDLTQDVFLLLQRGLPSFDPARELRPWVFTIVVNRVRDHWRSRRQRSEQELSLLDADESLEIEAPEPGPLEPLLLAESAQEVRRALDELPAGLSEVLYLRAFEGLEFSAIAALVGRNEVAVRKRYSRGLAELRRRLEVSA
jgi:RNA polymerase sigma factor (sigma-70 family)